MYPVVFYVIALRYCVFLYFILEDIRGRSQTIIKSIYIVFHGYAQSARGIQLCDARLRTCICAHRAVMCATARVYGTDGTTEAERGRSHRTHCTEMSEGNGRIDHEPPPRQRDRPAPTTLQTFPLEHRLNFGHGFVFSSGLESRRLTEPYDAMCYRNS